MANAAAFVDRYGIAHAPRKEGSAVYGIVNAVWCVCDRAGPTYGTHQSTHLTCLECVYLINQADSFHRKIAAILGAPQRVLRGEPP